MDLTVFAGRCSHDVVMFAVSAQGRPDWPRRTPDLPTLGTGVRYRRW